MSTCLAMLMDHERLHHERRLLAGLSCALLDQGVTLVHIVPETLERPLWEGAEQTPEVEHRLETQFRGSPWLRSLRTRQLADQVERVVPDFILGIGAHTWAVAMKLGKVLARPVGLEVWTRAMVQHVPRGKHASGVAAYLAPTAPLHDALGSVVDPALTCCVPWGVNVPTLETDRRHNNSHGRTIVITGSCRDVPAYQSLLSGLSRVVRDHPEVQAILELGGPNEHEIWRIVSRLGLHGHVTVTPDAAGPEQLLTRCDALLAPERYGETRSIILFAMAAGMTVIAAEDAMLDMLIDGETALTLEQPDAESWASAIRRVLTDHQLVGRLNRNAQAHIRRRHTARAQARTLVETVQRALDGGVLHFPADSGPS